MQQEAPALAKVQRRPPLSYTSLWLSMVEDMVVGGMEQEAPAPGGQQAVQVLTERKGDSRY
jgi:hypothetical protein